MLIPKANPTEPAARPGAPDFADGDGTGASKSDGLSLGLGDPLPGDSPFGLSGDAGVSAAGDGDADGSGTGEVEGREEWRVLFRTANTTTMSFWPFWQFLPLPLMKKNGPERPNVKIEWPSAKVCIGLVVLHA
jgi:hypothetical protein